jgi:cytochrome P450
MAAVRVAAHQLDPVGSSSTAEERRSAGDSSRLLSLPRLRQTYSGRIRDLNLIPVLADETSMAVPTPRLTSASRVEPPSSPLLAGTSRDSAPVIGQLREQDPVHWIPGIDAWFVSRHEDVQMLFSDPRVTADPRQFERYVAPTQPGAARWMAEPPFIAAKPGAPSPERQLVSPALTARAISRLENPIWNVVEQFAAPLRKRTGVVDLVSEFTDRVPGTVIGRLLGVPPKSEDEARFHKLSRNMVRLVNPVLTEKKRLKSERATAELCEYLLGLVRDRRTHPQNDLISGLLRLGDAQASSDEAIVRVASGLISAGTETLTLAAARALRTLFLHPTEMARLRRDRSLLPSAVSELLRYDMGLFGMPRYVLEDFELRGRFLQQGQLVVLSFMGAHRDPRAFDEPDRLDLCRETKNLIVFGHGLHHCIGSNLARTELRLMLDAALDFLPKEARLPEEQIDWGGLGILSRIKSLPVDFGE